MYIKKINIITILIFCFVSTAAGYNYDPNDFATEVVSYDPGSGVGFYDAPDTALGRPSVDTSYYGVQRPVVPVYPAWEEDALVTIGVSGHLVLKFSHKIADDRNNPYGFDFIVFGNAIQPIGGGDWTYGDPCAVIIESGQTGSEWGKVSVSQNGSIWYPFNSGPYADSFAPTLGRRFDPAHPNKGYAGWNNLWWGEITNPTVPLDPNLKPDSFAGISVAEMCKRYGKSAGGTSFDLKNLDPNDYAALAVDPNTECKWIQYIKIECTDPGPVPIYMPEIDAVADVSSCGDYKHPIAASDINRDCRVDYKDLAILCDYWLAQISNPQEPAKQADINKDNTVNFYDMAILASNWLYCNWECK
jgi:hypothetical protein